MKRILAIVLIFCIVTLTAVCICTDNCSAENDAPHCFVCCSTGCHNCILAGIIDKPLFMVSHAIFVKDNFNGIIFVSDIEHPPKASL
jgi:hypothetical protein